MLVNVLKENAWVNSLFKKLKLNSCSGMSWLYSKYEKKGLTNFLCGVNAVEEKKAHIIYIY